MLIEALGLLAVAWHPLGLGRDDGRLTTFAFLTLLFFALFSIVSIRERRPFWASRPSWVLAGALIADGCVGLLIGLLGVADLRPLPPGQVALIVGYAATCSLLVNDLVKLGLIARAARAASTHSLPEQKASMPWLSRTTASYERASRSKSSTVSRITGFPRWES